MPSPSNWFACDIYKADVYDYAGSKVGDVKDRDLNGDGAVMPAVIEVRGYLDAGEKVVAGPFKELELSTRNGKDSLVLDRTKYDLRPSTTKTP